MATLCTRYIIKAYCGRHHTILSALLAIHSFHAAAGITYQEHRARFVSNDVHHAIVGVTLAVCWVLGADDFKAGLSCVGFMREVRFKTSTTLFPVYCLQNHTFLLPAMYKFGNVGHKPCEKRLEWTTIIPWGACCLQYAGALAPTTIDVARLGQVLCEKLRIWTFTMLLSAYCFAVYRYLNGMRVEARLLLVGSVCRHHYC